MASVVDTLGLSRLVGTTTFLRGYSYAQQGQVIDVRQLKEPPRLFGRIKGTGAQPYTALVSMTKHREGSITSLDGRCTCPVSDNCKHVVALVLAASGDAYDRHVPKADAKWEKPAPWERSFTALLGGNDDPDDGTGCAPLALQFELIAGQTPGHGSTTYARSPREPVTPMRLGVRPVTHSDRGKWVRTGVSWQSLSYASYYGGPTYNPHHLRLLSELVLLSSADERRYYPQHEAWIYLDTLGSRRVWDLLEDARACGMPLVRSDRDQSLVQISEQEASIVLDVTRSTAELVLTPVLDLGLPHDEPVCHQLLGNPPHGVVVWPSITNPTVKPKDYSWSLARLSGPMSPELQTLLVQADRSDAALRIPVQDESKFLRDYYPRLRKRVALVSRNGSFELPEDAEPALSLTVTHLPEHQVELRWEWHYGADESRQLEPLWPDPADSWHRDLPFERRVIDSLPLPPADFDTLMRDSQMGRRLAPVSRLGGFDTVDFLVQTLPKLTQLDHLIVEIEGTAAEYRAADDDPVVDVTSTPSTDDHDWFDLAVTVSVDGEDVPFQEVFTALARDETHLILASGTYFSLERPVFKELKTLIEEARALQEAPDKGLRINRYQASLWDELQELGVVSAQASAWQQAVAALQDHDLIDTQVIPPTFKATLRAYQQVGFDWLTFLFQHQLGGVLADDMGLGKTIQALALIAHIGGNHGNDSPFLVVAPTSVVTNWVSECRRFAPDLRVVSVHETQARRGVELAELHAGADIVVTSYALFRLEFDDYQALGWTGLILDEAQFVKNHQSKAHLCARRLATPFKLAITGTPMENNLMELWSLLSITAPGLFPHPTRFADYYQRPIEKAQDGDRLAQLRRRISPFMLRRTKEQVVTDLPPKQEQVIELELHPKHKRVYETHLQRERQKVLGMIDDLDKHRFAIFRSLMVLRRISLDAGLVDAKYDHIPSTKLDALMLHLEDITAEGHRVLVFSQFTGFLDRARRRLDSAHIGYCYLDGSTRNRTKVIEDFRTGGAPVFLISLKAGGFGLNLTEADYCIILDPWWNPATEAQAVDRTHRIGQTKKVTVYRLVAKDTIEEKVMALKATKAKLFDAVMADDGPGGHKLSAADIKELLD